MRRPVPALAAVLFLLTFGCAGGSGEGEETRLAAAESLLAELDPGWNEIRPGGATICAQGTEFAFFARPAASDRLLVYFQGGGACWNAETCDPEGDPTYSRDVDARDNPAGRPTGIFDLDNPGNPLAEHSMVMVPYCTGDVHMGDADMTYFAANEDGTRRPFTVHHRGYTNATAALDWIAERYAAPAEIVVAGSSAGSIPSPFYAQVLADRYPGARIAALGDASGSYRHDPEGDDPSLSWSMLEVVQRHPGYEEFIPGTLDFKDFTIVAGRRHPELRLLQFDAANDQVQQFYVDLANEEPEPVRDLIAANQADIAAAVPNYRFYLAGGPEHTVLWRPAFYSYEVDGTPFRDWLAAALSGEDVANVSCAACDRPQLHLTEVDARIAERARELLADEASWSREDQARCPADGPGPLSLRCALLAAAAQVLGAPSNDAAAVLEARFEARARIEGELPARTDPLRVFNERAEGGLEGIRALLQTVAERAASHAHD